MKDGAGYVLCVVCTSGQRRGRPFLGGADGEHLPHILGRASFVLSWGGRLKRVEQARDTLVNKVAMSPRRVTPGAKNSFIQVLLIWNGDCINVLGLPKQNATDCIVETDIYFSQFWKLEFPRSR